MNEQENFQELKNRILVQYQKTYPYFQGNWNNFSSKDIRQLIDLIEIQLKERVSEKWIYTHLKSENNEKLPRKDMLDIFSRFAGFSDWDEFVFKNRSEPVTKTEEDPVKKKKVKWVLILLILLIPCIGLGIYFWKNKKHESKTIEIKNQYTNKPVGKGEVDVYTITEGEKKPVEIINSKIKIDEANAKIVIESPYFEKQEVETENVENEILVKPEDYALVLKTFINSDLSDWETRKKKLEKILSDDLEVIILLKENLGAEYLNKEEFSGKLTVPSSETKKLKILNLETNDQKQITFIRIQQL